MAGTCHLTVIALSTRPPSPSERMLVSRERVFCDAARDYLLSFSAEGVTPEVLSRYLEPGDRLRVDSVERVYYQLLWSSQNAQMRTAVVTGSMEGGMDALSPVLFGFNPGAVVEHYGDNWNAVLDDIVANVGPRGEMRRTPRSIWPQFCRSIVSGARFLTQFQDADAFYAWADQFDAESRTRPDLPVVISRQVSGVGFALACDFVKELGYSNFGKPDVHIKMILRGLGLIADKANDYEAFKTLTLFAESAGLSPYHVDKLMWLVGSGNFYLNREIGSVPTKRDEFVARVRPAFESSP